MKSKPLTPGEIVLFVLAALAAVLAGCKAGGSGATAAVAGSGTVGFLTGDAPVDDLSSVQMTVTEVILRRLDGSTTANLLAAPRTFDYLDLEQRRALLDFQELPVGTYPFVTITIDPASVRILDLDGVSVPVDVIRDTATDGLAGPDGPNLVVRPGDIHVIDLDVDLRFTLRDDPGVPGGLIFDLVIRASQETEPRAVEEFRGEVVSVDLEASSFEMLLLDEERPNRDFGGLEVVVEDSDTLVDAEGARFGSASAFLFALSPGVHVEGEGMLLPDGTLDASAVEIEESVRHPVELDGRILSVDHETGTLEMVLERVEEGHRIVDQVLGDLGDPDILLISFDEDTPVAGEDGGHPLGTDALLPGMEIDVRFERFAAPMPFAASGIEIDRIEIELDGVIVDTSGLPAWFKVRLRDEEPAVEEGHVTGLLKVDLAAAPEAEILLDAGWEPELDALDLLDGMKVTVEGRLAGTADLPVVAPALVVVRPGHLWGRVVAMESSPPVMTVAVRESDGCFGGPELGDLALIQLHRESWIEHEGVELSPSEVFHLFQTLGENQELGVHAVGFADSAGRITAYGMGIDRIGDDDEPSEDSVSGDEPSQDGDDDEPSEGDDDEPGDEPS